MLCLEIGSGTDLRPGDEYRRVRSQAAFAIQAAHAVGRELALVDRDWLGLAREVARDPAGFLAALLAGRTDSFQAVVRWTSLDQNRITPVPPAHWLLVCLPHRFRLKLTGDAGRRAVWLTAVRCDEGWVAALPPNQMAGEAELALEMYEDKVVRARGAIRFLGAEPAWSGCLEGIEHISRVAEQRTVLLTNGRGGMVRMNLDLGLVRSKYDCVLGANLHAELPVDRHILLKRVRVWANANGFISPLNADNLVRFRVGPPAEWRFRVPAGDGRSVFVRLHIGMVHGENAVKLEFTREQSVVTYDSSLRLSVRFDLEDRNFHWETKRNDAADHHFASHTRSLVGDSGFEFAPAADRGVRVIADGGTYHGAAEWSEHLPHPVEASRGQTGEGDGWSPGWFDLPLKNDDATVELIASAEFPFPSPKEPGTGENTEDERGGRLGGAFEQQLHRAASQFIVRRGDFKSVIAGYPWFLDWGRDTLICARGLIAGGWLDEVRQLLIVFGRFEQGGTLPNTIHGNDASNRDTSDAPLWYGVVAEELAAATNESVFELKVDAQRSVRDVLGSIAIGCLNGTANGIRVDRESGLVWSPSHFTWMDTNFPAGTPREGYPIEIQSLWIRLLRLLARLNVATKGRPWSELADLAQASLVRLYWIESKGWFADSLIAGSGVSVARAIPDQVLRSNCLIPISLGQLTGERARRCAEAARQYLVVPGALRTLAPLPAEPPLVIHGNHGGLLNDPSNPYWGHYEGDEDTRRKPAYHNGTAWTWTFPIFCEALVRAYDESPSAIAAARAYLGSMDRLLEEGCLGHLPEIVDGDAPHAQRGGDAQAWGATEALRVWRWLDQLRGR